MFQAIITSILLYGVECWALLKKEANIITVFYNNCVRRILKRCQYNESQRYSILQNCRDFGVLPFQALMDWRVLQWLGKIARMDGKRLPRKFLFATLSKNDHGIEKNGGFYGFHKHINKFFDVIFKGKEEERLNWVNLANHARVWDEFCVMCPLMYDHGGKKYRVEMSKYVEEMRKKVVIKKYEIRNWGDRVELNIGRVKKKKIASCVSLQETNNIIPSTGIIAWVKDQPLRCLQ